MEHNMKELYNRLIQLQELYFAKDEHSVSGNGNNLKLLDKSITSLLKKLPDPSSFSTLRLYKGMRISMESVERWLLAAGYLKESGVWEQGRWARRGGILDIATFGLDNPIRLEFFGDELESVRNFDQRSQTSARCFGKDFRIVSCAGNRPSQGLVLGIPFITRAESQVPYI